MVIKEITNFDVARTIHGVAKFQETPYLEIYEKSRTGSGIWVVIGKDYEDKLAFKCLQILVEERQDENGIAQFSSGMCLKVGKKTRQIVRNGYVAEKFESFEDYQPQGGGYDRPCLVVKPDGSLTVQDSCHNCYVLTQAEVEKLRLTAEKHAVLAKLYADSGITLNSQPS